MQNSKIEVASEQQQLEVTNIFDLSEWELRLLLDKK